jgi:hypothetical protein
MWSEINVIETRPSSSRRSILNRGNYFWVTQLKRFQVPPPCICMHVPRRAGRPGRATERRPAPGPPRFPGHCLSHRRRWMSATRINGHVRWKPALAMHLYWLLLAGRAAGSIADRVSRDCGAARRADQRSNSSRWIWSSSVGSLRWRGVLEGSSCGAAEQLKREQVRIGLDRLAAARRSGCLERLTDPNNREWVTEHMLTWMFFLL